jgi:hypothetical protein
MSTITIKDLTESMDLDRKAMLTIVGGARRGGYPVAIETKAPAEFRLVNYPTGFGHIRLAFGKPRK